MFNNIISFFYPDARTFSDLNSKDVTLGRKSEWLEIRNHFNHSIYFNVDSGTAAMIKWTPISNEKNRVRPNTTKRISLNETHGYKPGKTILFYYWSEKKPVSENTKLQRIETR